jgi:oligoendopeptidase F
MQQAEIKQANWDMSPFFSGVESADYRTFVADLGQELETLSSQAGELSALSSESLPTWVALLKRVEAADNRLEHLATYIYCESAADSSNEAVQAETGRFAELTAAMDKVLVPVRARLRASDEEAFQTLLAHEDIAAVRYYVERLRAAAREMMDENLESLTAELNVTGLSAWGRLYDQVSGSLTFELDVQGEEKRTLPVAMTRSLLEHKRAADSVAACLNAISGTRLSLYRRRGIEHFLDPALFDAGIERRTLDAMFDTIRQRAEIPRRYYRLKAKLMGKERLAWHDLSAPLPNANARAIPWESAKKRVLDSFSSFYPSLHEMAERAFADGWIDYEPRAAKRPGGFCASSHVVNQSRIFMTYNDAAGDVQTLAHELGHAFHSYLLNGQPYWSTKYPMTLAETASTFAEALVTDQLLAEADDKGKLSVLDAKLADAGVFLLNIPTRFSFEKALYEERASGEVSVTRLKELMAEAQRDWYGDAVDPEQLDPWFWASKLHYYITDVSFYNFPYAFGYLFSLGIFARAKRQGPSFLSTYEELLRDTGSATAEEVAQRSLGVDLGQADFWNESIDLIEADLKAFESALS